MKLGATITSDNHFKKQITKTANHRMVFDLNVNRELRGVITMEYKELNGSLNTHDEVEIRYFVTGGSGYKVIDTIKVPKNNGSLKHGKCDKCGSDEAEIETVDGNNLCEACETKRTIAENCEHSFIDADNDGVYGKEVCRKCGIGQEKDGGSLKHGKWCEECKKFIADDEIDVCDIPF